MDTSMANQFPFDCIIVTSPDAASAQSPNGAVEFLKRHIRQKYQQKVRLVSTSDPFGARCGSGGGTIAALEYASPGESVLVLHSGGDSSRCPTQMILGKAWTSMPNAVYRNPTIWLIDQLVSLFEVAKFPKGTMIVAATDCLLSFFEKGESLPKWNCQYSNKSVLGVAVPAPITTAKNHGVYIMPESILGELSVANSFKAPLAIAHPLDVWQKPSVEQLTVTKDPAPACFELPMKREKQAWIDTGLVVFLPEAGSILYNLAEGVLSRCTRKGLEALYRNEKKRGEQSLKNFARAHALKIDLYTDILHNLSWPGQADREESQLTPLQKALSQIPLEILVAPSGAFLHLGTSAELLNFFTQAIYPELEAVANLSVDLDAFSVLQPRFQCWRDPGPSKNIALQSTFPENAMVGNTTFVEYCDLASYDSVSIGDNCILSGWRNSANDTTPLIIPSNLCVQHLSLAESDGLVFMVFGIRDPIKAQRQGATLYGFSVQDFQRKTGISFDQLGWTEHDTMWTAKLHPIVPSGISFSSVFGWLEEMLAGGESISQNDSMSKWLSLPRVSLKELHQLADADAEWSFRRDLEFEIIQRQQNDFIPNLKNLLRQRCHDKPCNFQWLYEIEDKHVARKELLRILEALEDFACEELDHEHYDICGRAFMLASAILSDFESSMSEMKSPNLGSEITSASMAYIEILKSSSTTSKEEKLNAVTKIVEQQRKHMGKAQANYLAEYSVIMEHLAFSMIELSIAEGFRKSLDLVNGDNWITRRSEPTTSGKWVMAMAPARVDIAGGWSDTPPICYEFGGSVTGMAVLVDDFMPLSCRCRILPGKTGLLLRSEIRDSTSGWLCSVLETELSKILQLRDFRDPLSDCALIKSSLIVLGLAGEKDIHSGVNLQDRLNKFCSSEENVRLEIVTTSLLPQGSGMGTSSILGGCTLGAIAETVGIGELNGDCLIHAILMLEQLLSSGGGWQDQVHGIFPLIKTVRSNPAELPLKISIEQLGVDPIVLEKLEKRLILVFTGKTRLAKNILQNVLRQWARRASEIVDAVYQLVACSEAARSALLEGNLDLLGRTLSEYSRLKIRMAGKDSEVEPKVIKNLVTELMARDMIKGHSLCGAGGGGFLVMLASEGYEMHHISNLVKQELLKGDKDLELFTWHTCRISHQGLTTHIIEEDNISVESFQLAWQKIDSRVT
jgi:galactokinase/mevalonate kinase-like predicted kinase